MNTQPNIDLLRSIKTLPQLLAYLRDELDWPIENEDVEDLTFDYQPGELGLDAVAAVKIKEIKQLRPLTGNQPWGIFWINFENKRLPVVVMRRILRALVVKKRESSRQSERRAWQPNDLLFISAYGEESDRAITLAHFVEEQEPGNLAELRVLGWDDDDTPLKYDYVAATLHEKLRWRDDFETDPELWRDNWRSAFILRHREVITTSKDLAMALAKAAKRIRGRVRSILRNEDGFGQIRKLQRAFRQGLFHDMDDNAFADMLAQTVTYGLFSVAVRRTFPGAGTAVHREDVPNLITTSPFLKEMLGIFLGIKTRQGKLDFDELGLNDVTDILRSPDTHMEAVLRDFGNRTRGEDPVIHFYEQFLAEYDKQLKVQRGVFYTPQPVVSYIVRSVHELLQTEFGLEDGLADTTTWGGMLKRNPDLKLPDLSDDPATPKLLSPDEPFVQILDPATGTATFLVEVIDVIHKHLQDKWSKSGLSAMPRVANLKPTAGNLKFTDYWNAYVPQHLLPRLYGYELLAAPYAIAHLKLGLKLSETGYRFDTTERARIYLTNALEPKITQLPHVAFEPLAQEAKAVNEVKWYKRFTVIIGNPPYSRSSANKGDFIETMMEPYKRPVRDERNIQPLSDDYIKFIRFSECSLLQTGAGIHGMITNNTFLSGRIHRGMRASLLATFPLRCVVNLHGSGKVNLLGDRGVGDENVFDIVQGVAISILLRGGKSNQLHYEELVGKRDEKYARLSTNLIGTSRILTPSDPYVLWVPRSEEGAEEYQEFQSLSSLVRFYSVSGKPGDDSLLVSFEQEDVLTKLQCFRRQVKTTHEHKLTEAGRKLAHRPDNKPFKSSLVIPYAYRPFDIRHTYYDPDVWTRAVKPLKACVDGTPILLTTKLVKDPVFAHVFVSRVFTDVIFLSNTSSVNTYSFPLHILNEQGGLALNDGCGQTNLDTEVFAHKVGAPVREDDVFGYIYSVLHSPSYRERYYELLQYDFPRLPLTSSLDLFRALSKLGGELVALHLMESPKLDKHITKWIGGNNPEVGRVAWCDETVWIDAPAKRKDMPQKPGTSGFRGVPEDVWNFHIGGYQVCEKWLKDRKGRTLSGDDITHYHRIVVALSETIRIMAGIDQVIEAHGGWPEAFSPREPRK